MSRSDIDSYIRELSGPILITGASGFVGANLLKLILGHRADVYGTCQKEPGWRLKDVDETHIIANDFNDSVLTTNLIRRLKPQTVFHCVAYGAYSFETDSNLIYETNFLSLANLVQTLRTEGCGVFVHAGSSSEYGSNSAAPTEESPHHPNSPYAVSKNAASSLLWFSGKSLGFPCLNLRLYSVYGPLEDTSRLVPTMVRLAITDRCYPQLVSPEVSRDFVYVDDVCEAMVLAAVRIHPGIYGESINIGSGEKVTVRDLALLVRDTFELDVDPVFGSMNERAWDLVDWYSNSRKAEATLGWRAETSLSEGLTRTASWIRELSFDEVRVATKINTSIGRKSVSAIIACYKDAEAIPIMHQRLTAAFLSADVDYEMIFVNDGSPDDSERVISEISAADPHVIGISHSRNFGSQMAFRSGMEMSSMDAVVLLDGDLQDPPELIPRFVEEWTSGNDVVFGRRVKREMSRVQGFLYKAFYRVFAAFSYIRIPHDAGDFSLIDKRVVWWILQSPERDLFMRGLRAYVGFKQTGVDYVRPERMFGRSTNNLFKNLDWAKKGIFSFSNTPLTMLTTTGLLGLIASILSAFCLAVLRIAFPDIAPRGVTTLLVVVLMLGSLNLFAIGLVGEYVAKIMTEVKQRPRLIRSAIVRRGEVIRLIPDGKSVERDYRQK